MSRNRKHSDATAGPTQRRLMIPLAVLLLLLVGGFAATLLHTQRGNLRQAGLESLAVAVQDFEGHLDEQSGMLSALEDVFVREASLTDALKALDRDRLLTDYEDVFTDLRAQYGITHFYFQRPDRVNLLRVHNPERSGDLINRL